MTTYNASILAAAGEYLGLEEWPGAKNNPAILGMFKDVGHSWVAADEVPWCAAFCGAVLASLGLPHTRKLNARSYVDYGSEVEPTNAIPGDIVVLWRNSPNAAEGHVGFFVRYEGDKVVLRGGNQGNKVSDAPYPIGRIIAVRRADGRVAGPSRPTLRAGDKGAFVLDLQDQLDRLSYFSGRIDGDFGPLTRQAVLAFQADQGLTVDGIVGPQTWDALAKAQPRPQREVTMDDLAGSRTIDATNKGATALGGAVSVAGVGSIIQTVQSLEGAEGALAVVSRLVTDHWPALIAMGLCVLVYVVYLRRIQALRLEDAKTGRHLGR